MFNSLVGPLFKLLAMTVVSSQLCSLSVQTYGSKETQLQTKLFHYTTWDVLCIVWVPLTGTTLGCVMGVWEFDWECYVTTLLTLHNIVDYWGSL